MHFCADTYIVGAFYQLKENYKSDPASPNLMYTNLNVMYEQDLSTEFRMNFDLTRV